MPAKLFVAPNGTAGNPGTAAKPLPSIGAARDQIRALRQDGKAESATVVVAAGTYALTGPIEFGPADGNVTYVANDGAGPILSGSREITGFATRKDGLWQAKIGDVAAGTWYFEQLYVNGARATRARYPDGQDLIKIKSVREEVIVQGKNARMAQEARQFIELDEKDFSLLAGLTPAAVKDVHFVAFHKWDNTRRFIESIVPEKHQIVIHGAGMKAWNPLKEGTRFYLENLSSALTAPGEWFLDRDGTLLYKPRQGEKLADTTFCAPITEHLIKVTGTPEEPVKGHARGAGQGAGVRRAGVRLHGLPDSSRRLRSDPGRAVHRRGDPGRPCHGPAAGELHAARALPLCRVVPGRLS
jgi:hypothetical protein